MKKSSSHTRNRSWPSLPVAHGLGQGAEPVCATPSTATATGSSGRHHHCTCRWPVSRQVHVDQDSKCSSSELQNKTNASN
jgi:hypothetical protein